MRPNRVRHVYEIGNPTLFVALNVSRCISQTRASHDRRVLQGAGKLGNGGINGAEPGFIEGGDRLGIRKRRNASKAFASDVATVTAGALDSARKSV
jgi:hypothetical protein